MFVIIYVDVFGLATEREELLDKSISFLKYKGLELQSEGVFQDYFWHHRFYIARWINAHDSVMTYQENA